MLQESELSFLRIDLTEVANGDSLMGSLLIRCLAGTSSDKGGNILVNTDLMSVYPHSR